LLPGAPAVELYGCNDPAHPDCKQPAGSRCINAKGKRVAPHPKRWNLGQGYADAWNKRQAEVDSLKASLSDAQDLRRQDQEASAAYSATLRADIAHLEAKIAELESPPAPPEPKMLVGAAVGGNADPAPLEKSLGKPLRVHRTYWGGSQVDKAAATCSADTAAGRVPFITFKLPYSWKDMASGKGDAWARDLAGKLALIGGPVWVDFHHEPEGDGVASDWTAMQQRLIPLVKSANVKVGVCYTGYQETHGDQTWTFEKTFPSEAQFLAVDIYQMYGTVNATTKKPLLKWSPLDTYYAQVSAFAKEVGVPWGLGETGVTDEALAAKPTALADLFGSARGNDAGFLAYFSSSLNSTGSWPLTGPKLDAFSKELQ
jgi:hypothetical protein